MREKEKELLEHLQAFSLAFAVFRLEDSKGKVNMRKYSRRSITWEKLDMGAILGL